jgi:hypothetical protein
MPVQYMDEGFRPHMDRGFKAALIRLETSSLDVDPDGETAQHSRAMVEHVLTLESEPIPAVTAELFAEAIAVADAIREAQGKRPVTPARAGTFWEVLKELIDSVREQ